uniref:Uncharacterized protein n=1 Tax=Tanacetum cinerariifolium TaxID=118510 RepID=A0A6L2LJX2_TANCI|nr:hypothetical protein [Tanacetum cinerariifolium]
MKKINYGHFEEIEVRQEDQKLYTFREDERYDLDVALRMFTRRIVIQSDGTLVFVWTALHDIASGIRMKYLPKKNQNRLDKRSAQVMIQNIDKQLFQRRLMRNLEKFVGGKEYGIDLRLLERTI